MENQYIDLLNNDVFIKKMSFLRIAKDKFKEIIEELNESLISDLVEFSLNPLMFGLEENSIEIKVIRVILEIVNK